MNDDTRQDFILRITQANASAMVVILYDMFLSYSREALAADPKSEAFLSAVRHARGCLSELINSLHMEQELARNIYPVYRFIERRLIMAQVRLCTDDLPRCVAMMEKLRNAYAESVRDDHSAPLMKNADLVYAGMTYGPDDLKMQASAAGTNRGYLA